MTCASAELQTAIYAALAADAHLIAEVGIHDAPPHGARFPYISFGQTSVSDWSTASEPGSEHLFSLHVWSRATSREQVFGIMDKVNRCLGLRPSLNALRLVDLALTFSEVRYDEDLMLYRGLMRYRARIELAA